MAIRDNFKVSGFLKMCFFSIKLHCTSLRGLSVGIRLLDTDCGNKMEWLLLQEKGFTMEWMAARWLAGLVFLSDSVL